MIYEVSGCGGMLDNWFPAVTTFTGTDCLLSLFPIMDSNDGDHKFETRILKTVFMEGLKTPRCLLTPAVIATVVEVCELLSWGVWARGGSGRP